MMMDHYDTLNYYSEPDTISQSAMHLFFSTANMTQESLAIYLHIPFCTTKCTYCAFNTYTHIEHLIPAFVEALAAEIRFVAQQNPYQQVHTVYFGGGTPSLLTPSQFDLLLNTLHTHFAINANAEISIESNPNDLDAAYLGQLRTLGINRLSIGMQTANINELDLFARRHDHAAVVKAVDAARTAKFDNLNLDVIYGFPYQTLESWQYTLNEVALLKPEHISMYALGLEEGTSLLHWVESGRIPTPDDDTAADMYDAATDIMAQHGYHQYEISNWAQPGYECQHNLQYWRNFPYVGLGPGAHGYAGGVRYHTLLSPQRYIKAMRERSGEALPFPQTPATHEAHLVEWGDEMAETLIMNLRLLQEGVSRSAFEARFGVDLVQHHAKALKRFVDHGLVEIQPDVVRITHEGRLLSNMLFRELV
ncbi:MAG: radical SAM family heme chaperone HemW [Anaerolineae bacterium]